MVRVSQYFIAWGLATKHHILRPNQREGRVMRTDHIIMGIVMVGLLALIAWLPALPTQAADQPSAKPAVSAPAGGLSIAAAGAVGDTLKDCVARIPKGATAGQRLIAEQGCKQEAEARASIQAVPGQ